MSKRDESLLTLDEIADIKEAVEDAVFSGQATDTKPVAITKAQLAKIYPIARSEGYKEGREIGRTLTLKAVGEWLENLYLPYVSYDDLEALKRGEMPE